MIILITYDITSPRRLTALNKYLKEYGLNSQKSVFECPIDNNGLGRIRRWCKGNLDLEHDSVRIYKICSACLDKAVAVGLSSPTPRNGFMVV